MRRCEGVVRMCGQIVGSSREVVHIIRPSVKTSGNASMRPSGALVEKKGGKERIWFGCGCEGYDGVIG